MIRNLYIHLIFIFLFPCSTLFAQDITTFFLQIPDRDCLGLDQAQRTSLLSSFVKGERTFPRNGSQFYIEKLDKKNGYLKLGGAFEGYWEMTYWNLSTGSQLLGICETSLLSASCRQELIFYQHQKGQGLTRIAPETLIPPVDLFSFFDQMKGNQDGISWEQYVGDLPLKPFEDIEISLPQSGKDLQARFCLMPTESQLKTLTPYLLRDKLKLSWKDGFFISETSSLPTEIEQEMALGEDITGTFLKDHDLSKTIKNPFYLKECPHIGTFGPQFQRLDIQIVKVEKLPHPAMYYLEGLSRLKDNIVPFSGTLTFKGISYRSELSQELAELIMVADYELKERSLTPGSGQFSGEFSATIPARKLENGNYQLLETHSTYEEGHNKGFRGIWQSYRNGKIKQASWGFHRPDFNQYDQGASEPMIDAIIAKGWIPDTILEQEINRFIEQIPVSDLSHFGLTSRREAKEKWYTLSQKMKQPILIPLEPYLACKDEWWK